MVGAVGQSCEVALSRPREHAAGRVHFPRHKVRHGDGLQRSKIVAQPPSSRSAISASFVAAGAPPRCVGFMPFAASQAQRQRARPAHGSLRPQAASRLGRPRDFIHLRAAVARATGLRRAGTLAAGAGASCSSSVSRPPRHHGRAEARGVVGRSVWAAATMASLHVAAVPAESKRDGTRGCGLRRAAARAFAFARLKARERPREAPSRRCVRCRCPRRPSSTLTPPPRHAPRLVGQRRGRSSVERRYSNKLRSPSVTSRRRRRDMPPASAASAGRTQRSTTLDESASRSGGGSVALVVAT